MRLRRTAVGEDGRRVRWELDEGLDWVVMEGFFLRRGWPIGT